jgi:tetratricopeptide (TPR) repeat protein
MADPAAEVGDMTPVARVASSDPAPDEIRAELTRITASDVFSNSPQLISFLTFIVEAALNGKSDRLKGYVIGVEVLRRDVSFDPMVDPIVRVEATRLRRALVRYYAGPGANDDVIIAVPLGAYVPAFSRRTADNAPTEETEEPAADQPIEVAAPRERMSWRQGVRPSRLIMFALLLGAAGIAMIFLLQSGRGRAPQAVSAPVRDDIATTSRGNGMPTLVINRLDVAGTPGPQSPSPTQLRERLIDAFSRFDLINITAEPQPGQSTDYALNGLVEYNDDGTATVSFRLRDVAEGVEVWSRTFDRIPSGNARPAETKAIIDLASSLLQPFGVIHSRERAKSLADARGDPRYRCVLLAMDAIRSRESMQHDSARSCLEKLTAADESFVAGLLWLAVIYDDEYVFGTGRDGASPRALDRALVLARRGIELAPASGRAYQVLGAVLFARGETKAAIEAMEHAVELNRYDGFIQAGFGGRLITVGEVDRGLTLMAQTPERDTVRPSWMHFYLFLGNYLKGNYADAGYHADGITSDANPLGLAARALMAAHAGDSAKATLLLRRLVALRPAWRDDARGELRRAIPAADIVERLARDLDAAGLQTIRAGN